MRYSLTATQLNMMIYYQFIIIQMKSQKQKSRLKLYLNTKTCHNVIIMAISFMSYVLSQSQQGIPSHSISTAMTFSMGSTDYISNPTQPGFELNFWLLPFFTAAGSGRFMTICSDIQLSTVYDTSGTNPQLGIAMSQGGNQTIANLPLVSNSNWVNMNLRVSYSNYILLNGWQGNNWYNIAPSFSIEYLTNLTNNYSIPLYNDTTLTIEMSGTQQGAHIADLRIFILGTVSWGQYLRQYQTMSPTQFKLALQEIYVQSNNLFYSSGINTQYDLSSLTLMTLTALQCPLYYGMQSDGTCSTKCLTSKCQVCQTTDSKYFNLCRYCDPTSSSCTAVSTCPTDYYMHFGVCYQCPAGCSACTNATRCTTCDSGLIIRQTYASTTSVAMVNGVNVTTVTPWLYKQYCDCPDGQFGTVNTVASTLTCASCDSSCATCYGTSVACTSCSSPKFLYNSLCVTSCSDMQSNLYGEVSNRTCTPCATNCSTCNNATGCTLCKSQTFLNGSSGQLLNFAGICVEKCPTNSIPRPLTKSCDKCLDNCTLCSTIFSNCTGCIQNFNLYNTGTTQFTGVCLNNYCPSGYFSKNSVCTKCDPSCVLCDAENYCTKCTFNAANAAQQYFFVNYQCKITCPDKYYPDITNTPYIFCRNCPSNCLTCTDQTTCATCLPNYYLTTFTGYKLCVSVNDCPDGQFAFNNAGSLVCSSCSANCKNCSSASVCNQCFDGYYLDTTANTCSASCATGYFPQPDATCGSCPSNCNACTSSVSCTTCATNYVLLTDQQICHSGTTCPAGYYMDTTTSTCMPCRTECSTCTNANICTGCKIGYYLASQSCLSLCGNSLRQGFEECDDGNNVNGDGCDSMCRVETQFACYQGNAVKDACYCDPDFLYAQWIDNWGTIQLQFKQPLYYWNVNSLKSDDPATFCYQILDTSSLNSIGSTYECSITISDGNQTTILISVGGDSTIASNSQSFSASITFLSNILRINNGCNSTGIPLTYSIQNEALETPLVLFSYSSGTTSIGQCASDYTISIHQSKGLTKRNVQVVWTAITLIPTDSSTLASLQQDIFDQCLNQIICTIPAATIQNLVSKQLSIKVTVTNFLGLSGNNQTALTFLSNKKIEILDIPDVANLVILNANQISPRFRIPYCQADSKANIVADQSSIVYTCELYSNATLAPKNLLSQCTIPMNFMSLALTYIVRINASFPSQPSYSTSKNIFVQPRQPDIQIASIYGCNRKFNSDESFFLKVFHNNLLANTQYIWSCIDVATGSTCFSRSYSYIQVGNTQTINLQKGLFFYGQTYEFTVTTTDLVSSTTDSMSCMMQSAKQGQKVLAIGIISESIYSGFMDFVKIKNAFKAYALNSTSSVNLLMPTAKYSWLVQDSSMNQLSQSILQTYVNSMALPSKSMTPTTDYVVSVSVAVSDYFGYGNLTLRSQPDISAEFRVQPSSGMALSTIFTMIATTQEIIEPMNQYIFGYLDPSDQSTKRPVQQRSIKRWISLTLPAPQNSGTSLTCYVDIIQPNGVIRTYQQVVTLSQPTLSSSDFNSQVQNAVMDDLIESMQIKNKLQSLSSSLTVTDKSAAIKKILWGLQNETTPLSDYYIQTSTASLLEYISTQNDSLLQDGTLITTASAIFTQITTNENTLISSGQYRQFTKAATISLFNFANNIFQIDFSTLIGASAQKTMKTSFMSGLKNVLKGSLSNQILGDIGGFSYQGQNIYAKAVKFDQLETSYTIFASLPKSLSGTLSQAFSNFTLPPAGSVSNPCTGYEACQVSVIILDQPVNTFISNSKESSLKSMIVDLSIQSTEIASTNASYVSIKELTVKGLSSPIQITIPLTSALNTSNSNRTLGCGYIDENDQIFKNDGVTITTISTTLVTCKATHLTAFGVEEYTSEVTQGDSSGETTIDVPSDDDSPDAKTTSMMSSWAIYISIVMLIIMGVGMLWAYRKDKRDQVNLSQGIVRNDKDKLYLGVFLEPIITVNPNSQKKDTNKLMTTVPQMEEIKKKQSVQPTQYEQIDNLNDTIRAPQAVNHQEDIGWANQGNNVQPPLDPYNQVMMPPPLSPMGAAPKENPDFFADVTGMSKKSKKVMKKKKKKKKGVQDNGANNPDEFDQTIGDFRQNGGFGQSQKRPLNQENDNNNQRQNSNSSHLENNIFFEGGDQENREEQIIEEIDYWYEYEQDESLDLRFGIQFEGGSDEEGAQTLGDEGAASTIRSKRSKKKKKKRSGSKSGNNSFRGDRSIERQPGFPQGNVFDAKIQDYDDDMKSKNNGPSSRVSQRSAVNQNNVSARGSAQGQMNQNAANNFPQMNNHDEDDIKFNSQFGSFPLNQRQASQMFQEEQENIGAPFNDINPGASNRSRLSVGGKKKKKGKKGRRASSRSSRSQSDGDDDASQLSKPDYEAEVISNRSKRPTMDYVNKSDLLKPAMPKKVRDTDRDNTSASKLNKPQAQVETKGFDTLMQEPNQQPNLAGVPKITTKKTMRRPKRENPGAVKPRRFQEEQAGCCVFFCWNCKESHRLCSLYRHYNQNLSRMSRLLLLFMSFYMYIMISGFLIASDTKLVAAKDSRSEQFICGLFAALISKFWIIILATIMKHSRREQIYQQNYDAIYSRRLVKFNTIRYWFGVSLALITILISFVLIFSLSGQMVKTRLAYWGWAFLFSLVGDFIFVEGIALGLQTVTTMIVGASPDACGKCRNCWLEIVQQSIKDSVK